MSFPARSLYPAYRAAERIARTSLIAFTALRLPTYDPQFFHCTIADVLYGEDDRVIINLPPRHGKSELCSVSYPPHYLAQQERRGLILSSYGASLSTSFGRRGRNIADSSLFNRVFNLELDRAAGTAAHNWSLTNGSEFLAVGRRGGATGRGGDVVVDDPLKDRKEADSAVIREECKDHFRDVLITRLPPGGRVFVIMTRWHWDDLAGWLMREWPEESWKVYNFPAIKLEDPTPLDPRRPGEALWPSRFSLQRLERIREEIGPHSFNCLYQGTPSRGGQQILRSVWLVPFNHKELPVFKRVIQSWDTAFEDKTRNDWNVGFTLGETDTSIYVLDEVRFRATFPQTKRRVQAFYDKWDRPSAVLMERAASGRDLINTFRQESNMPIIGIEAKMSKTQRADSVSGRFEAGRIKIPESAPWISDLMQEIDQFPDGAHDDQVDALCQGVNWLIKYGAPV